MHRSTTTSSTARRLGAAFATAAVVLTGAAVAAPAGAVTASADVGVTLSRSPNLATAGDTVTYTATVTNSGPDAATGVVLLDPINVVGQVPQGAAVTTTSGTCSSTTYGIVQCSLGTIAASGSVTVTIPIAVQYSGVVKNTVAVGATSDDPNSANDQASVSLAVLPGPSYGERLAVGYFKALIGRSPTKAETDLWSDRFERDSIGDVVRMLTSTNTYRTHWIDRQFRRYLHRPAGSGGGYYLKWLQAGRTYDQVTASILSSDEYYNRAQACPGADCYGVHPPLNFIQSAYFDLTGDITDISNSALLRRYATFMAAGGTRYQVVSSIIPGLEARRKFIDRTTRLWLHRGASELEMSIATHMIKVGQSTPEIAEASILASYSFYGPFVQGCCGDVVPVYGGAPRASADSSATAATASSH